MTEKYKPFQPKPEHLKVGNIKRQEKWEEDLANTDNDISHRRFNTTLHVNQVVTSFKKCVHKNEISKEALMTCYRVVLQKLLQNPDLSDTDFISMYQQIQSKAHKVYAARNAKYKNIK